MDQQPQTDVASLLNELKSKGIDSGIIRKDGILAYGSLPAGGENTAAIISSVANTAEALLSKVKNSSKETEIALEGSFLVLIPLKDFILCSMVKDREQKQLLRECAEKVRLLL